ncbi:hypothetical protein CALCODRAFT_488785 [Calocera cornea HHB12733]|uniref:F-box domain-containing protein n=1 Tax=Calocera cornea HHB12733 TaxID=1353952 RepID=A0A165C6X6_9BASI|nr:hypothetical protein CALCODRAFT_488785 [Calocera cornea HHB12733]
MSTTPPPVPRTGSLLSLLPLELLDAIALLLPKPSLYSLLLVSRTGYATFVRALYRNMDITVSGSENSGTALALIDTLARSERLVLMIKHLRLYLFLNAEGTTRELLLQISRFFQSIPAHRSPIHTFRFSAWLEDWEDPAEQAIVQDLAAVGPTILGSFNALRLPCLHTLILDGALPGLSYLFDARPFLRAHPQLRTIDVSSQFLVPDAEAIPHLTQYTGRPLDVINLCHHGLRPLRALKLWLPSSGCVLAADGDGTGESDELILACLGETKTLTDLRLIPCWPEGTCIDVRGCGQGCMPPALVGRIVQVGKGLTHVELYIGDTLRETLAVLRGLNYLQDLTLHCQREVWDSTSLPPSLLPASAPGSLIVAHDDPDSLLDAEVFPPSGPCSSRALVEEILLPACAQLERAAVEWRGWKRWWGEEVEDGEFADWEMRCAWVVRRGGEAEGARLEEVR